MNAQEDEHSGTSKLEAAICEIEGTATPGLEPDWRPLLKIFPDLAEEIREHFKLRRFLKNDWPNFGKRYSVFKELPGGSQGSVFLAEQNDLKSRCVVIKRADPKWIENELEGLASMRHPNIAQVLDAGEDYVVVEYIEGSKSITQFCDENNLSIQDRLRMFLEVCHAVMHCHSMRILHRDLKPSNILVQTSSPGQGIPKLVDFGLSGFASKPKKLCSSGTVDYMSPEMLQGESSSVQSEVFALGVILCEILVGSRPLQHISTQKESQEANREFAIPSQILQGSEMKRELANRRKTQIRELKNLLQLDLDWIVKKALEADPARRFSTVSDLANRVTIFLDGSLNPDRAIEGTLSYAWYAVSKTFKMRRAILSVLTIAVASTTLVGAAFYRSHAASERWRDRINAKQLAILRSSEPDVFLAKVREVASQEYAPLADGLLELQGDVQPESILAERRDAIVRAVVTKQMPPTRKIQMILDSSIPDELAAISPLLHKSSQEEQENLRSLLQSKSQVSVNGDSRLLGEFFLRLSLERTGVNAESKVRSDRDVDASLIASRLCDTSNRELDTWCSVLEPFGEVLDKPLLAISGNTRERASRRLKAARALASLNRREHEKLVKWLIEAPNELVLPFLSELGNNREESITSTRRLVDCSPIDDASANKYVFAACALASLGESDTLWSCLKGDLGEAARCRAVVFSRYREVPLNSLIKKVVSTKDNLELASLIEAIGFYSKEEADPDRLNAFIKSCQASFSENTDAHVHAACLWLFRNWGLDIPQILPSSSIPSSDRQWFRSPSYLDFMTLTIPKTDGADSDHSYRIAVSVKEISVADYSLFLELEGKRDLPEADRARLFLAKKEVSPEMDSPQNSVSWTAAARFCNWLSEREAIDSTQLCFDCEESDPLSDGSRSRWVKENYTSFHGYRLPTIEEAEVIIRGLRTPFVAPQVGNAKEVVFPWGCDPILLDEFAMTARNAKGRTWPAGSRLPNNLGLFDTMGSLLEWTSCFDDAKTRAFLSGGNFINDDPSLFNPKPIARQFPDSTNFYLGFRVVRTIDTREEQTIP